jgi:hypothetical protein
MDKENFMEYNFAICLDNKDYAASLEVGKIYRVIADDEAGRHGYVRVIDESGEDYAYSKDRFFPIELPQSVKKALSLTIVLSDER